MTITATDIQAGPFIATGAVQTVPYEFMTLGDAEVELVYGEGEVALPQNLYAVTPNTDVRGLPEEGGSVAIAAGALTPGVEFYLRANPTPEQPQEWSDTGSRLRNLNPALDRLTLLFLRGQSRLERAIIAAGDSIGLISKVSLTALAASTGAALVGFIQLSANAVIRNLQDKLRESVSVEDFGAVGDGIADDTVAIQRALDYATAFLRVNADQDSQLAGGITVRLSNKKYKISDTLYVTLGTYFKGQGATNSILENLTTNKPFVRNDAGAVYNVYGGCISDFAIYGNPALPEQHGVELLRPYRMRAERLHIQNVGGWGHVVRQGVLGTSRQIEAVGCGLGGFLTGEGFASWEDPNPTAEHYPCMNHLFEDCHGVRNLGPGFRAGPYTNGVRVLNGGFEYNYRDAGDNVGFNIELLNTGSFLPNNINNVGTEGPVEAHILIDAASSSNHLTRWDHYGAGPTGEVDRALIIRAGDAYIDTPQGHGVTYRLMAGSIAPFRLTKASARIFLKNPRGCGLTRTTAWVEDETGAVTNLSNNLFQNADGVIRGAHPRVYTYLGDLAGEWFRDDMSFPYMRIEPFYQALAFGGGFGDPDVSITRKGAGILGLGNGGLSFQAPRFDHETSTVAALPVATAGRRAFVMDATATTHGTVVAGGGAEKVPVYADGTNWRIG